METLSRRQFLRHTTVLAATTALPALLPATALGLGNNIAPSARITMGGIGLGDQGTRDLQNFLSQKDVRFLAVCDVKPARLIAAKQLVDKTYNNHDCPAYHDFRYILQRKDIDAVLIATGDRWHTLASIMAARAGKDMYCEKPMSLTVAEGRLLADTVKRFGTVYQCGTQRRSMRNFAFAVHVARQGLIGKLHTLHSFLNVGPQIKPLPPEPVPAGFDFDTWLGPAPFYPYNKTFVQFAWKFNYNYAGGMLTDWGVHCNDLCQWANNTDNTGPIKYEGWAKFPPDGFCDTPLRFHVVAHYANGVRLIFHDEPLLPQRFSGRPLSVMFEGDEGWIYTDDNGNVAAQPESLLSKQKFAKMKWYDLGNWRGHHRNFLNCVKTRQTPIAPAETAHRSTTICHIGNICVRLGRSLHWDPLKERFINDIEANKMLSRGHRSDWCRYF